MWKKYGKARQATDRNNITRRMRTARWITTATDTHSEYLTLIAFPWQQRLCEHGATLRCMQTAPLVNPCCHHAPFALFLIKIQACSV